MKKVKIMLLSFALIAVIGGALAFKANMNLVEEYCIADPFENPLNGDKYCTYDPIGPEPTTTVECVTFLINGTADPVIGSPETCYTLTDDDACQTLCPGGAEDVYPNI